jgi:polyhydroxyalkanoate synthase subunit PhaE
MTDKPSSADALADTIAQWTAQWRQLAELPFNAGTAWTNSMLPFIMTRASEQRTGLGDELGDAIERMAQGPKLADVWDIDRKLMNVFLAWTKMRQKLAAYNANSSRPWMRALERHRASSSDDKPASASWRDDFAAWSTIANEELIRNQRSEEFLHVQRELLQAGIEFRKTQTELSETVSGLFGLPTQSEFDELSRQLTELRREVRALARNGAASRGDGIAPPAEQKGAAHE